MNDFKGLARDSSIIKTPEQMWQFARNILIGNKYQSITNEKGNEYGYKIPGVVIGYIITNEDIVYFSIDGIYSCIGYVNQYRQQYIAVLRTSNPNFKFNINSPIEGVYVYNYKKELVIVFSDGVNPNSNTPKLINLHNPQVLLSPTKEFINADDYLMFELFNYNQLPNCDFEYSKGGLDAEVVHLSFCYVFADNTDGFYSPIIKTVYPAFKGFNKEKNNINFKLTNLSYQFNKIKLAFIIKKEAGTFAYTSDIISINEDHSVDFTLSSEKNLTIANIEEIIITSERFNRIRTLTKTANQIEIANVSKKEDENWQIYANKLELKLDVVRHNDNLEKYKTHPFFLPDEVYSFKIVPIFLDGTEGNAFHIPGRLPKENITTTSNRIIKENDILNNEEIGFLGLNFSRFLNNNYRYFHFYNKGKITNTEQSFGYWENEEKYPNKSYYNSSIIGGEDLRGKPIRYHRMPAINTINTSLLFGDYKPRVTDDIHEDIGKLPKIYVFISNFDDVFPLEIKNKLQGYKLVFEKRKRGNTYIEETGFLYNAIVPTDTGSLYKELEVRSYDKAIYFNTSVFVNSSIIIDTPTINSPIIKIYKPVKRENNIINTSYNGFTGYTKYLDNTRVKMLNRNSPYYPSFSPEFRDNEQMAFISSYEYKKANNATLDNDYAEEKLVLQLKHLANGDSDESFVPFKELVASDSGTASISFGSINNGLPLQQDVIIGYSALITLNKNLYNFNSNTEYITSSLVLFSDLETVKGEGDVFSTSIIKKLISAKYSSKWNDNNVKGEDQTFYPLSIYFLRTFYFYNFYSPFSNEYVINGVAFNKTVLVNSDVDKSGRYPSAYYFNFETSSINILNSFDYSTLVKTTRLASYFNDYVSYIPLNLLENKINYFPYRIYKGLAIPNESLQTKNLRFFPTNSYYDMRNDRGEIIALRGYNRGLYIQQRYSLFESYIADKLNATAEETYLGSSELFDRIPEEILYNDNIGYIGSNSQFACIIFRDGYATVDEEQGKVFIVNKGLSEISQQNLKNYFRQALPLGNNYTKKDLLGNTVKVDNPFSSIGYLIGFDEEYNRLILTKKYYTPKNNTIDLTFDGEFYYDERNKKIDFDNESYFINESKTFSFALDSKTWVCEHDYFPNAYFYNNKGFFLSKSVIGGNTKIYKHNSNKVNPGNFFGKQYQSYVDLIFNGRLDISKQYQALNWVSEAFDIATNTELQFDTIDKVMFYNNHQCSGYIEVSKTDLKTSRNAEGIWQLNEFRDMLISPDKKILNDDGSLITNNISLQKQWFNKGMFFGNFIVVRMLWNNTTKVLKHIHNVNVKSVLSQR